MSGSPRGGGVPESSRFTYELLPLEGMVSSREGPSPFTKPKFLRQFGQLGEAVKQAVGQYIDAVKNSTFPNQEESY